MLVARVYDDNNPTPVRVAKVTGETYRDVCMNLQPMLIAVHAARPKAKLRFVIDGEQDMDGATLFRARCLYPGCAKQKLQLESRIPPELVGALTLVFHTSHEGHPIELRYGDHVWRSPVERGRVVAP
jgi:hypothetical protein